MLELRNSARGPDTRFTYFQAPVRVEDAFGRVFPFPSECSPKALDAEIKTRFKEGISKGISKEAVMAGLYKIVDAKTNKQLLPLPGHDILLPGMSISMTFTYTELRSGFWFSVGWSWGLIQKYYS